MANRRKEKKLVRVTVNLDPDDYKRFDEIASGQGLSAAYLIRKAMQEFLSKQAAQEAGTKA